MYTDAYIYICIFIYICFVRVYTLPFIIIFKYVYIDIFAMVKSRERIDCARTAVGDIILFLIIFCFS